jgi:anti-sigma-K factor RskA
MSQTTDIHTLSGAYALDALTEIERAGFARHMAECEACAAEVAELTETASRLGGTASEAPPPRLRDAVLHEIRGTRQVTVGRVEAAGHPDRALRRWRRWTAASVAAGVIAVGGVAAVGLVQERRLSDVRDQVSALEVERARVNAVLAAGDVRVRSQAVAGGGTVTVAISPSLDDGVVLVSNLPTPRADKAYQLWLIRGSVPTSAGIMAAGQGSGTTLLDSVTGVDMLGVTLEPATGSLAPTPPILAGVALA